MTTPLDSIKSYIGFGEGDADALRAFLPVAEPHLHGFAERFYACIQEHDEAHQVLEGHEQIERLKRTLEQWMRTGLAGPHDHAYYVMRSRIGRRHVLIGLPQRFMFTAMNLIRRDFHHLAATHFAGDPAARLRLDDALDRLFDMELAIMLQTYQEDSDARLRRHERLATIGQIAASIGHDLRNPLGVMQSSLYILRKRAGEDGRALRHIEKIDSQIRICDDIIRNLLELARNTPPRREPIDFGKLFDDAIEAAAMPAHVSVQTEIAPGVECRADPVLLRQAMVNLLTNAAQAHAERPGHVHLSASATATGTVIAVADDGPGFDPDTLLRVFEPLVTTRSSGIGLGLALVKGVTERHGGTVEASNRPEGGALVRLHLPRTTDEETRTDAH
ncbi:MAG TPA: HAMP domain-containing sensor histidine kinase [Haliangium sp.]|nr:HAMP domain-containing sensor histidine kinase [Haliangium sp.]